jgi:hypothetical protein
MARRTRRTLLEMAGAAAAVKQVQAHGAAIARKPVQ